MPKIKGDEPPTMFVRWKKRKLARRRRDKPDRWSLYAVLVRCERVGGKPRQKIVRHLAHIKEHFLKMI